MALHAAVLRGDFSVVRRLVESGVEVNGRDAEGRTPLMLCCLHDGEDWAVGVARMILMHEGRVGSSDGRGRSALTYAVLYQRLGLVRMFLRALDFDLNARDLRGQTALGYAAQTGNQAVMELLAQAWRRRGLTFRNPAAELRPQQPACGPNPLEFKNLLPYKTLPEKLWKNRERERKNREIRRELEPENPGDQPQTGGAAPENKSRDWRLDMRSLLDALQAQSSASYRPKAQPRPSAPRPRPRGSRAGKSRALLRRKGRRMSLSALEEKVSLRRRCTLPAPPNTQQRRRASVW